MKKAISKLLVVLALTFLVNIIQVKAAEMQSLILINISVAHSLNSKQPITIYEIDNKTNKDIDLAISSQSFKSAGFLGNREERKSKMATFINKKLIISKLKPTDITNKIAVYHKSDSNKIDVNLYIRLSDNNSFSIKEKDIKEYLSKFKSKQELSIGNKSEEYVIEYNIESG